MALTVLKVLERCAGQYWVLRQARQFWAGKTRKFQQPRLISAEEERGRRVVRPQEREMGESAKNKECLRLHAYIWMSGEERLSKLATLGRGNAEVRGHTRANRWVARDHQILIT